MSGKRLPSETSWTERSPDPVAVVLVVPPSAFLLDERVFASLGILKVAAALEARGHPVTVLDLSGIDNYLDPLRQYLSGCEDVAIGVTTTTPQLPAALKIAEVARELRPEIRRILGGPHVTLCTSALKIEQQRGAGGGRAERAVNQLRAAFDVLVSGDGELAVLAALEPDAGWHIDGDSPQAGYFLSDEQFTSSPWAARHLIDLSSYHYEIAGHNATSLIAQLGCPFGCGFCGGRNSRSLRKIRTRSVASIVAELEHLHRTYGYTGFMFYDDELNVSKTVVELMNEITALQERLGVEFRLRGFVKSELFTKEQAQAMYRAGFRWLLCGYEAADPRILVNIAKRATLEDNTRCVGLAKEAGLKVKALMSCGHPGETEASIRSIAGWLERVGVDDFDCTVITTYPGTPYYDLAVPHESLADVWTYVHPKTGDRLHAYDVDFSTTPDYYKGDPEDGYQSYVFTDALSSKEIVTLRNWVEATVREQLGIPFNPGRPAMRYEHSMGQGLPDTILRQSAALRPR